MHERPPRIAVVLALLALWVLAITVLHGVLNGGGPARGGAGRSLAVGGLPVT